MLIGREQYNTSLAAQITFFKKKGNSQAGTSFKHNELSLEELKDKILIRSCFALGACLYDPTLPGRD